MRKSDESPVSIPYRLATNPFIYEIDFSNIFAFQFLIGWLQTCNLYSSPRKNARFQFLIGWLQTNGQQILAADIDDGFNSLQVGYKRKRSSLFIEKVRVFQFLIGWLQTSIKQCFHTQKSICFNSLQVGYKRVLS